MAETDDAANEQDEAELREFIAVQAEALHLIMVGVLTARLGLDTPMGRRIAWVAVSALLSQIMVADVTLNPGALPAALFALDAVRDATGAAAEGAIGISAGTATTMH